MDLQRFAFSTSAFSRHPLDDALKQIAAAGFSNVELVADKPHAWLESFETANIADLKRTLERLELSVSSVNAGSASGYWTDAPPEPLYEPSLISADRALREWRVAYTKKALRLGKELGASDVSITSGRALHGVTPEKARKFLVEALRRLIEYAEKIGQRLSIEYERSLLIESANEAAELVGDLKSKNFGASVNIAVSADPIDAIKSLKGSVFNVHLSDIRGGKCYPRAPGDGDLNFSRIFKALADTGYDGRLTWNLYTCDDDPELACRQAFKFTKTACRKAELVR